MFAAIALTACSTVSAPLQEMPTCTSKLAGQAGAVDLSMTAGSGRRVPTTVFFPGSAGTYPIIAFSHGAFAAPRRYDAMLSPLAAAGYIVIAPMHRDSEEFGLDKAPSQQEVWATRNKDLTLALSLPSEVRSMLENRGIVPNDSAKVAMGHSYGALIAQLAGGARALIPVGAGSDAQSGDEAAKLRSVIAWSPPGPTPGMMADTGWASMAAPSLTITGTKDVLPGFIDDWQAHTSSFDAAPSGKKALWVGEDVDHYFGGAFGRIKPIDTQTRRLFARALQRTAQFLDRTTGDQTPCQLPASFEGESFKEG